MQLAIDSLPLAESLIASNDYSGVQLHSLTTASLADAQILSVSDQLFEINLNIEIRWDDGSRVTGHDFARGIEEAFRVRPTLMRLLFKDLLRVRYTSYALRFELSKPNIHFGEILKVPFLNPLNPQKKGSGPFMSVGQKRNVFDFVAKTEISQIKKIQVTHVQCPQKNLQMFVNGKLDVTADTAVPLELEDQELEQSQTGLYAGFQFSKELSREIHSDTRRALTGLIADINFFSIHFGKYTPWMTLPKQGNLSIPVFNKPLRIAYDDFYPNKDLAVAVATVLNQQNIATELVRDDYYKPHADFDLKFVIRKAVRPTSYFSFLTFLGDPALRTNRGALKDFVEALRRWESHERNAQESVKDCEAAIHSAASFIPLFAIPSMALNRSGRRNPLLRLLTQ